MRVFLRGLSNVSKKGANSPHTTRECIRALLTSYRQSEPNFFAKYSSPPRKIWNCVIAGGYRVSKKYIHDKNSVSWSSHSRAGKSERQQSPRLIRTCLGSDNSVRCWCAVLLANTADNIPHCMCLDVDITRAPEGTTHLYRRTRWQSWVLIFQVETRVESGLTRVSPPRFYSKK